MKIIKYKKGAKGLYKVDLEDGTVLSLYEEVILKYNLLLTKDVDDSIKDEMFDYNLECEVYYVALNNIKARAKSQNDLRKFLLNKEYPTELVDKAIDKLISQGYLNDRSYAKSFINSQIVTTTNGPLKIERELLDKKIDYKMIRSNHTRGGMVLKQKILNDLKNYGYDVSVINRIIDDYDFNNGEDDIAKKEYDKLYTKYSRKYSGVELQRKIKEKLYLKGLKYEPKEND